MGILLEKLRSLLGAAIEMGRGEMLMLVEAVFMCSRRSRFNSRGMMHVNICKASRTILKPFEGALGPGPI